MLEHENLTLEESPGKAVRLSTAGQRLKYLICSCGRLVEYLPGCGWSVHPCPGCEEGRGFAPHLHADVCHGPLHPRPCQAPAPPQVSSPVPQLYHLARVIDDLLSEAYSTTEFKQKIS